MALEVIVSRATWPTRHGTAEHRISVDALVSILQAWSLEKSRVSWTESAFRSPSTRLACANSNCERAKAMSSRASRTSNSLAGKCRFGDCTHSTEPGRALTAAVEDGSLNEDRDRNYMKLHKEVRRLQRFQELREHTREDGDLSRVHGTRQTMERIREPIRGQRDFDRVSTVDRDEL